MSEKHYAFLKNNIVMDIAVFAEQDEELANRVAQEQGFDDALWLGENPVPYKWSTYDSKNKVFIEPTVETLIEFGALRPEAIKAFESASTDFIDAEVVEPAQAIEAPTE